MRSTPRLVLPLALVLLAASAAGAPAEEVLTNDHVVQMHRAGLAASVIVAKIESSAGDFDTSVDALVTLAGEGIPDQVIAAMTGGGGNAAAAPSTTRVEHAGTLVVGRQATAAPTVRTRFDDPHCPSPGVFVEEADGGVRELDPTAYAGSKTAGRWKSALTYGILSTKSKAMIQGLTSHNRVDERSPTFWFCFEEAESGLSYETSGATTPSQFLLVDLDIVERQNARLLVTGKINNYTGGYAGPPPKYRRDLTYEKVSAGVYEVAANGLGPGEYAFFYTGSTSASAATSYGLSNNAGGGKVFDFSIR